MARIWALRLGCGPQDWDLGLETGIWASGLAFQGGGTKKKEKIPHICESIGHGPLQGRCPAPSHNFKHNQLRQGTGTADHLTLLRLLLYQRFLAF